MGRINAILLAIFVLLVSCNKTKGPDKCDYTAVNPKGIALVSVDSITEKSYTPYEKLLFAKGFVDIGTLDSTIQVDLRYASSNNFMDTVIYDSLHHAFMHKETAKKFLLAQQFLNQMDSNLSLIVFDALRPKKVQFKLYEQVKGTPKQKYVASPGAGSMHNFGFAVDVSIVDKEGALLDMGTKFDHFGPEAEYRNNWRLLQQGELTQEQINNRKLLREVMRKAVFVPIDSEWWHFNTFNREYVRANYKVVD